VSENEQKALKTARKYMWWNIGAGLIPRPVAAVTESVLLNGGSAWALGKVFIRHFESSGTFLNFKSEEVNEYFRAQLEEGRKLAATMGTEAQA
jgi:hypothetical protein